MSFLLFALFVIFVSFVNFRFCLLVFAIFGDFDCGAKKPQRHVASFAKFGCSCFFFVFLFSEFQAVQVPTMTHAPNAPPNKKKSSKTISNVEKNK